MILRDYQQAAHDAFLHAWGVESFDLEKRYAALIDRLEKNPFKGLADMNGERPRSILGNLATSAGKTIIVAKVIETLHRMGKRCLFVADSDELCMQPLDKIHRATGIIAALEKADHRASLQAQVVVGSAQTLIRQSRLQRFPADHFDFVVFDEAHRGADRNKVIADHFHSAKIGGLTATAFRAKLADLSQWYERVAFEMGTFDLVGQGYVTGIKVLTLPIEVDLNAVKTKAGDYDETELDTTIEPHYRAIARVILERAARRRILAFLPLIRSSEAFVRVCQQEGIAAVHCDGRMDNRDEIIARFERGDFQLLSNSAVFTTGVDFQQCDCILNLRPTKSPGLFRQIVGRGLRIPPGIIDGLDTAAARLTAIAASHKPNTLLLDLLWQTEKMGLQGPAGLLASNEQDYGAMAKAIREGVSEQDLMEVHARVQAAKEDQLRKELERVARRRESLMDARMVGVLLHQPDLMAFEPVSPWEKKRVTPGQATALEKRGVDPESCSCAGQASQVLSAIVGRSAIGLAPMEAFEALKAKGVERPEACSLDDAIRTLGDGFPMTFGKHRGKPFRDIDKGYWHWVHTKAEDTTDQIGGFLVNHPAVVRYARFVCGARQPQLL